MSNDKSIEFPTIKNRDENGEVNMEVLNETIDLYQNEYILTSN